VRRLMRPRPTKEIVPGSQLDETDVAEAELMVEFVGACRTYAHELAVNEMTMRSYAELQNYLESGTKVLLDGLRQAGDADRPFRQSQMDAAIRFCRCVFCRLRRSIGESGRNCRSDHRFRPQIRAGLRAAACVIVRNCRAQAPIAAALGPC